MSRIPRLLEWSVSLYRLLLAAYPAAFRQEYGESMAQLFRDSALDGYRYRGLWGLLAVWPRTLVDFTISMVRQHREKPVGASSESVLLRDLLRQWSQFGCAALAVSTFSLWYALHLLHLFSRRTFLIRTILTTVAFGIWGLSFVIPFGSPFTHICGTTLYVTNGSLEIYHLYEVGEPISWEQWWSDCQSRMKKDLALGNRLVFSSALPWEFSFLPEFHFGRGFQPGGPDHLPEIIMPCKEWRLRLPFVILPLLLLCWTIRVRLRGNTVSRPAVQSA